MEAVLRGIDEYYAASPHPPEDGAPPGAEPQTGLVVWRAACRVPPCPAGGGGAALRCRMPAATGPRPSRTPLSPTPPGRHRGAPAAVHQPRAQPGGRHGDGGPGGRPVRRRQQRGRCAPQRRRPFAASGGEGACRRGRQPAACCGRSGRCSGWRAELGHLPAPRSSPPAGVALTGNPMAGEWEELRPALKMAQRLGLKVVLEAGEVSERGEAQGLEGRGAWGRGVRDRSAALARRAPTRCT